MSYRDNYYGDYLPFDMMDDRRYSPYDFPPPWSWYDFEYSPYDAPGYYPAPPPPRPVKKPVKNSHLYKTELCSQWLAKGSCPYNHRCRFAHGPRELRPITRDANYRSKPCRKFKAQGWCPYGARCTFIHDPRDVKANLLEPKSISEGKCIPIPKELLEKAPVENEISKENSNAKLKSVSAKLEMTQKLREKEQHKKVDVLTRAFGELAADFSNTEN